MPTPSFLNSILNLTLANPSYVGTIQASGFLVNSSSTRWVAKVTDNASQVVFHATHSSTDFKPFSHPLPKTLLITNPDISTSSKTDSIFIYTA